MRPMRITWVMALVLALSAGGASAQALVERIPADAIFYAGWAGAEKLGPAYKTSNLKGVMDASQLGQFISGLGAELTGRLGKERSPDAQFFAQQMLPLLQTLGQVTWNRPTALYVGPLDTTAKKPMPRVAVLIDAAQDAQKIQDQLTKLVGQIPPEAPVKVRVQVWGGKIVAVSNFELGERLEESLSQREAFKKALAQGRPDPALVAYLDVEKILSIVSVGIMMGGGQREKEMFQRVMTTTGIGGLKRVLVTAGFDGKDWGTQAFLDAPQPRIGMLAALLDGKGVGDDLLKWAPRSTDWLMATRCDLAKLVSDLRAGVASVAPEARQGVDQAVQQVNAMLGFDLEQDLLAALGDQWMLFNSRETGHGTLGLTLVQPLRNPEKVRSSLTRLEKQLNDLLARQLEKEKMTIAFETARDNDLEYHYLAIPAIAPCWAIKGQNLYVSLYPQVLVAAAAHDGSASNSVLASENFVAARKRLGVGEPRSLSYMDLKALAPRGYPMVMLLQRTVLGFADMFGVQTPPLILPPLNKLQPFLGSSISATWVDESGWHARGITPFPGAGVLGGEQAVMTTVVPLTIAVAAPAMFRARQQALEIRSGNNLRQIGMAIQMYTVEHKGALPPDLAALLPEVGSPMVFVSQRRALSSPPPAGAAEIGPWINANSDYVYLGGKFKKFAEIAQPSQTVLAHEKLELVDGGMVGVLFADGHVETLPAAELRERLQN